MAWTPEETADRVRQLRFEACQFLGIAPADLDTRLVEAKGTEGVLNWLGWAQCEWAYGWPPDIAEKATALGIASALDFGCGVGEVGFHLAAQLDIPVTFADLPGLSREFVCWRLGARYLYNTGRPQDPEEALGGADCWDLTLCLEVLEHIPGAPEMLRLLLKHTGVALCLSGALGRPEEVDTDPLHVYRGSLLPVLETEGWGLLHGGGMPWWFVRRELARERGLALLNADGSAA